MTSDRPSGYRFGDITVDLAARCVRRDGEAITLGKLSYDLLLALLASAPGVVTREELSEQVWGGRFVTPATVKQRIVLLRKALADDANDPSYIRVVRGHGYAIIPHVETLVGSRGGGESRTHLFVAATLALAVIAATAWLIWSPDPPAAAPTLAVLPFENLSPDPDDAYFAAGLREEVIDRLGQVDGMQVVSRKVAEQFSNSAASIQDVASEFGVEAVLEGSVSYRDGYVRVSTRLVDPDNGLQTWSHIYEREADNVFRVQADIAVAVAGAMGVKLGIRSPNAFSGAGTENIKAYEAFLAGLQVLGEAQGQDRAIAFFRRAAEIDPDYAAAWAQIGYAIAAKSFYAPTERTGDILDEAMPYLLRAVELDPHSARAASMLGFVRYSRLDWIGGAREHARAIELDTNRLTLGQHASLLVRAGRVAAARTEFNAADSIGRVTDRPGLMHVQVNIAQRRYDDARSIAALEDIPILRQRLMLNIALNEGDAETIKGAIAALMAVEIASRPFYSRLAKVFDSQEAALDLLRATHLDEDIRWPARRHDIALLAAYFNDPQLAIESFSAEASVSTVRLWALWYPVMSEARQLLAFKNLVTDLNLVGYWRTYGWADACTPVGESDFRCS